MTRLIFNYWVNSPEGDLCLECRSRMDAFEAREKSKNERLSKLLSSVDAYLVSEPTALTKEEAIEWLEKIIEAEKRTSLDDEYLSSKNQSTRKGEEIGEYMYGVVHVEAGLVLKLLKALL